MGQPVYRSLARPVEGHEQGVPPDRGGDFDAEAPASAPGFQRYLAARDQPVAARGGRPRRYFTVTRAGLAALRASRAAVAELSRGLESVLGRR